MPRDYKREAELEKKRYRRIHVKLTQEDAKRLDFVIGYRQTGVTDWLKGKIRDEFEEVKENDEEQG